MDTYFNPMKELLKKTSDEQYRMDKLLNSLTS